MKEMRSMGGGTVHIFCVSQAAIKCILIVTNLCLHTSNSISLVAKNIPEGLFQHTNTQTESFQNDHCNVFSTLADVWHEANSF